MKNNSSQIWLHFMAIYLGGLCCLCAMDGLWWLCLRYGTGYMALCVHVTLPSRWIWAHGQSSSMMRNKQVAPDESGEKEMKKKNTNKDENKTNIENEKTREKRE